MIHPVVEAIIEYLPEWLSNPPEKNHFARKERSGWFHASDLNCGGNIKFSPRRCVMQYLGIGQPKVWSPESSFSVAVGSAIDMFAEVAMERADCIVEVQPDLRDPMLHFRGSPDMLFDDCGDILPGDVKSTDRYTAENYWGNPRWDASNAYWWRQVQAYLHLTQADSGIIVAVDRAGPSRFRKLEDCFYARDYHRDGKCIAGILKDLEYMNACVANYTAATDDIGREASLPAK